MLGINTQGARNGIQEDMLTEPEGIGHLNDEDAEGIQAECGRYAKRTLSNGILLVMRVQQKRLVLLMYWFKYKRQLRKMTDIFNGVDKPTVRKMIKEANERESCKEQQKRKVETRKKYDF